MYPATNNNRITYLMELGGHLDRVVFWNKVEGDPICAGFMNDTSGAVSKPIPKVPGHASTMALKT